ncbi:MAG: glutathione S-transferase N-terminal domain-containing protein [Chromatiaceae bacterium]
MKLYDYPCSGNCHKLRLMPSLLGLDYERVPVDSTTRETLTPEFRRLNPRGQIPVLDDGGTIIWDSLAILVYLARRAGGEPWLPADARGEARVMQWLAVSETFGNPVGAFKRRFRLSTSWGNLRLNREEGVSHDDRKCDPRVSSVDPGS